MIRRLLQRSDEAANEKLLEEIELLDGASAEFDHGTGVRRENLSPVFFGSALTNFGVETFLAAFLEDDVLAASEQSRYRGRLIRFRRISLRLYLRFRQT